MPYKRLMAAKKRTVGSKETLKAIEKEQARVVYVARNADRHVIDPIILASNKKGIPVIEVESMLSLGKACRIEVGCASAAIVEE
ncbi:MAG: ribosomal L7Ae/L30e/S12e/Gadd45 family protein [Pelotomaculum sp.]|jgi:large subunit ribosomal protein L7A